MYSILFSKINEISKENIEKCFQYINIKKLAIFPWTFADEKMENISEDFLEEGGRHYEKYISQMEILGITREKIQFANPYKITRDKIIEILNSCDGIFIPGGNPEMFMTLAIRLNALDLLTNYTGIIIGESAGSVLQFPIYGLPIQNNYYECNSFYNGFGAIKCDFSIDVHTQDNIEYLNNIQLLANKKNICIFTIPNDSYMVINRKTNEVFKFGNINKICPNN